MTAIDQVVQSEGITEICLPVADIRLVDPVEGNVQLVGKVLTEDQSSFEDAFRLRWTRILRRVGATADLHEILGRRFEVFVLDVENGIEESSILEQPEAVFPPPSGLLILFSCRLLPLDHELGGPAVRHCVFDHEHLGAVGWLARHVARDITQEHGGCRCRLLGVIVVQDEIRFVSGPGFSVCGEQRDRSEK